MDRQLRWGDASRMDNANDARSLILRAALEVMVVHGSEGFSIDDVASRANISRRTLYRYFANKKELLQAVIGAENAAFFDEMQSSLEGFEADLERYLEESVCFSVRYLDRHNGGFHHSYLAKSSTADVLSFIVENVAPMWQRLLEEPYRRYVERYGEAVISMSNLIAVVSRITLTYCLVPESESAIRQQIAMLRLVHREV